MKKILLTAAIAMLTIEIYAQYNVGTSTSSRTDMFGNTVTTHRDTYGRTTGTSTTFSEGLTTGVGISLSIMEIFISE